MTAQEIAQEVAEINATLRVLRTELSSVRHTLLTEPLEVDVTITHANRTRVVRRPHPALQRMRSLSAAVHTLERDLKKLTAQGAVLADVQELAQSPWNDEEK
jgi:hypothetical protein